MSSPSLLICCTSPHPDRGQELEDWLEGAVARFGCEEIGLYRTLREGPIRAEDPTAGRPDGMWFLVVLGRSAVDSAALAEVVAEMRLLGLSPTIFHPGPMGIAPRDLASFF
jgi:hypothetical protein